MDSSIKIILIIPIILLFRLSISINLIVTFLTIILLLFIYVVFTIMNRMIDHFTTETELLNLNNG